MEAKQFELPIFNPGKQVKYNGKEYTIDHVRINGHNIKVKFKELSEEVDAIYIYCNPTVFVLK